ncbi:MAG: hypothetical protein ACTTGU_05025 [Moraxella sp.]
MCGKTILMVTHRLGMVKHADNILVFDKGCLKEQGTHDGLLARQGIYTSLRQAYEQGRAWHYSR